MTTPYTIKYGDTLSGLALKNGVSLQSILSANPNIKDANKIVAGGSLIIPTKATTTPSTTIQNTSTQRATDTQTQSDYNAILASKGLTTGTPAPTTTTPTTPVNTTTNPTPNPTVTPVAQDVNSSITALYTSGITDPTAIYTELSKTIPNLTSDQISTQIGALAKDPNAFATASNNKQVKDQIALLDKQRDDFNIELTKMKTTLDAENASAVDSIMANSAKSREILKNSYLTNKSNTEKANYATDAFRYVTNQAEGNIAHQEQDFVVNMATIDAQEKQLLLQASSAKSKGDWDLLNKQVEQFNKISDDKRNLISNMITISTNYLKNIQEEAKLTAKAGALPTPAQANTIAKGNAVAIAGEMAGMNAKEQEDYFTKKAKELNIGVDVLKSAVKTAGVSTATAEARLKKAQAPAKGSTKSTGTKKTITQQRTEDITTITDDFLAQMKKRNWKGANPTAYNAYKKQVVAQYGSAGATELDKAMKALGIIVDTTK